LPLPARKNAPKIAPSTIGNAGVYHVCTELSLRGLVAVPTVRNAAGIDVIVSDVDGEHIADLQVKTSQSRVGFWPTPMPEKISSSPNVWFVFLRWIERESRFQGFVLPSSEVQSGVMRVIERQREKERQVFPAWELPKATDAQAKLEADWSTWSPAGVGTVRRLI